MHAAALHRATGSRARQRPGIGGGGIRLVAGGPGPLASPARPPRDLQDLVRAGLRIANREVGSEARRLLDEEMARLEIAPDQLAGYETECTAHLLVASAVASGLADAGVTTEPAALAYSLDFIPWQEELSELHIPTSLVGSLEVRALLDVLAGRELPAQLAALDGYDAAPCGRIWRMILAADPGLLRPASAAAGQLPVSFPRAGTPCSGEVVPDGQVAPLPSPVE